MKRFLRALLIAAAVVGLGGVARAASVAASVEVELAGLIADGREIDGAITIGYAPHGTTNAVVMINGEKFVEASEAGSRLWTPTKGGEYALKHAVGDIALEATYTVPSRPIILRCEWSDYDNALGLRPESVDVTVYTNAVAYTTVSVAAAENWLAKLDVDFDVNDIEVTCRVTNAGRDYTASVVRYAYSKFSSLRIKDSVLTRAGWQPLGGVTLGAVLYTEKGWLSCGKVTLGSAVVVPSDGDGDFFVVTNQLCTEPGDGDVPEGGLSKFDTMVVYDGAGHTIKTNELRTAFAAILDGETVIEYAPGDAAGDGTPALPWQAEAPAYTNVGEYVVWYKVTNPNYEDFVHAAKVKITPRTIDPSEIFGGNERDDQGRFVCERVYNSAAQAFAVSPDFDEPYRFTYALVEGDESAYSETAPTRTHVAEGDLVVYFKFLSDNYEPYSGVGVLRVVAKTLTDEMCVADEDAAWFYDGTEKKPAVTVVDGSPNIATTNDYTLTYSGRTGAGLFPVTVTGTNDYCGTVTKEFAIMKRPVVPPTIPATSYNGRTRKATVPSDDRWTVVANPGGVDAGAYTNVVLELTNTEDYRWKGLDEDEARWTGVLVIVRGPNGWSRTPSLADWAEGATPSEPNCGKPRNGTVTVILYRARGADVATATTTQPTKAGLYTARFVVEETVNYQGTYYDVDFAVTGGATGDATTTTPVPVPYTWLEPYLAAYGSGDYESAGNATGANGLALWASYVAGLDPTDQDSQLRAHIAMDESGAPVVTWTPDLRSDAKPRVYTTLGKPTLDAATWTPVTDANKASMRFFKVKVEMK